MELQARQDTQENPTDVQKLTEERDQPIELQRARN